MNRRLHNCLATLAAFTAATAFSASVTAQTITTYKPSLPKDPYTVKPPAEQTINQIAPPATVAAPSELHTNTPPEPFKVPQPVDPYDTPTNDVPNPSDQWHRNPAPPPAYSVPTRTIAPPQRWDLPGAITTNVWVQPLNIPPPPSAVAPKKNTTPSAWGK